MRLNDLIIKCSNIRLEDNIIIHALIKDNATDEIEKIENSTYTALEILNSDLLSNIEVANFELMNNSFMITTILYQTFNN